MESTMAHDIRWKQRFDNYLKALQTVTEAVELSKERPLSKLEQQGLILTHVIWSIRRSIFA
jgi:hypothetical protein